jgi:predicted DNA-binding transcriptional regulator AlpA
MSVTTTKARKAGADEMPRPRRLPLPASVVGLMNKHQVCDALGGCSTKKLDLMRKAGEFPQPDARLGRHPRWSVELVNAWVRGQVAGKSGAEVVPEGRS